MSYCVHSILAIAPPDLKRGLNVGDLGPAQPLEILPIARIGVCHIPECAEFLEYLAGQAILLFSVLRCTLNVNHYGLIDHVILFIQD